MSRIRNKFEGSCDCRRTSSPAGSATNAAIAKSKRSAKTRIIFSFLLGLVVAGARAEETAATPEAAELALPVAGALAPSDAELFAVQRVMVSETGSDAIEPIVVTNGMADPAREWHTVARLRTKATYDSNIFISSDKEVADVYVSAIPELTVGWGDFRREFVSMMGLPSRFRKAPDGSDLRNFLFATYAPEAVYFGENPGENTIDQDLALQGAYRTGRWTFNLLSRFQTLSDPDIEIGSRADRTVLTLDLDAAYWISDKTSLAGRFSARREDYQEGIDTTNLLAQLYADYRVGARTTMGLGFGFGYLATDAGSDRTYEQLLARANYAWSDKLSFALTTGVEFRQAVEGEDSTVDPLLKLSSGWKLSGETRLLFSASRRLDSSSVDAAETIEYTTVEVRLRQELWQRIYLNLDGGYTEANYARQSSTRANAREDSFFFIGLSVAAELSPHLSAEASYRYQNNDSTRESNSFVRSLAEFQLGYQF